MGTPFSPARVTLGGSISAWNMTVVGRVGELEQGLFDVGGAEGGELVDLWRGNR